MKLVMAFVIDDDGYLVRYGADYDEKKHTPAQGVAFRSLRNRYKELQRVAADQAHENDAAAAEALLQDEPKIRRMTRKVG